MDKYDILVEEMTPKRFLQRLNNFFLIKDFLEVGHEGENLSELNICIMNLHDTCLSDIITGNKNSLVSYSLAGHRGESRDRYYWPPKPSPKKIWEKWQATLWSIYRTSQSKKFPRQLQLGHWNTGIQVTGWIHLSQEDRIYQLIDRGWHAYKPVLKRQGREIHKRFVRIRNNIKR